MSELPGVKVEQLVQACVNLVNYEINYISICLVWSRGWWMELRKNIWPSYSVVLNGQASRTGLRHNHTFVSKKNLFK